MDSNEVRAAAEAGIAADSAAAAAAQAATAPGTAHHASSPLVHTNDAAFDDAVAATVAFADAFVRWSGRKAVEAGANVTRLRLLYSVHSHGPQKMANLAYELDVTPRNITALVDGLESEGLVRRVPHATDRRITLVELTCNSSRVEEQFAMYQASLAALFGELSEADRSTLLRLMTVLHDRIHADATCVAARQELADA